MSSSDSDAADGVEQVRFQQKGNAQFLSAGLAEHPTLAILRLAHNSDIIGVSTLHHLAMLFGAVHKGPAVFIAAGRSQFSCCG